MPDWTEWLTEDERRWLPSVWCRVRTSPACGECLGCASVLAFRTIAALRALVEERKEALEWNEAAFTEALQKSEPAGEGWFKVPPGVLTLLGEVETGNAKALALTEDDMRERLEKEHGDA